ncbi:MAG: hypothetical protein ABL898_18445 [Hyphomicrobiaceae bacterium]
MADQVEDVLRQLDKFLAACSSSLAGVLQVTICVTNLARRSQISIASGKLISKRRTYLP